MSLLCFSRQAACSVVPAAWNFRDFRVGRALKEKPGAGAFHSPSYSGGSHPFSTTLFCSLFGKPISVHCIIQTPPPLVLMDQTSGGHSQVTEGGREQGQGLTALASSCVRVVLAEALLQHVFRLYHTQQPPWPPVPLGFQMVMGS